MIDVIKAQNIEDEKEREEALAVIAARDAYYERLFAGAKHKPRITLRYEGGRPLQIHVKFMPPSGAPVVISVDSYLDAVAATKYALKKLRRVAKNYFIKQKARRHLSPRRV